MKTGKRLQTGKLLQPGSRARISGDFSGKTAGDIEPLERGDTVRRELARLLRERSLTARELSAELSLPEREVSEHLEHLERSLVAQNQSLVLEPARCIGCGFAFADRRRYRRPSRCPHCRSERITQPAFRIESR